MFDIPPEKVFWCYGHRTALHESLVKKNFNMIEGLPNNFDFVTPNTLIMLDDLMEESSNDPRVSNLFTRSAHHVPCFVIKTTQNIFPRGTQTRNHRLNTNYLVLFKNPADRLQIQNLENQMFPHSKHFLVRAFESATNNPHSYLFLDLHKKTAEHVRVRARILPNQRPMVAYVDKRRFGGITTSKFLKTRRIINPRHMESYSML